jgi:hypothetical protein
MYFLRRLLETVTAPLRLLLYSPGRIFSPVGRLMGVSLPARVAILTWVFLLVSVITAFLGFYLTRDRVAWEYWLNPLRVVTIVALLFLIPVVVYYLLKMWLEGEESLFPDIDYAWKAGLEELRRHDLNLMDVPIFLVLGSDGEVAEKSLFDASRLSLRVREVPGGPAALHWYANPDGIYLVCTDTSCLSKLAAVARSAQEQEKSGAVPATSPGPAGGIRGTIVAGDPLRSSDAPAVADSGAPESPEGGGLPPGADIRGTMQVGGGGLETPEVAAAAQKRPVTLAAGEANELERRLEYVCKLLRRVRQPLCPINGMLTLLPYGLIKRGPREGVEVQRALQRDMRTVRQSLKLRFPVTALVTGMEEESGFRELVRRVGRDRAAGQRFGRGFSLWTPPLPERLEALCAHSCGAFEDWAYALFRERGSLSKPGNTRLYALLCQIRRNVRKRLANILVAGYGHDPDPQPEGPPGLFGGCYFAATGESEDRQAFVKGVFDKLPDQQHELEWADEALIDDDRFQRLALGGLALDCLLLLALAGMFLHRWVL